MRKPKQRLTPEQVRHYARVAVTRLAEHIGRDRLRIHALEREARYAHRTHVGLAIALLLTLLATGAHVALCH